MLDATGKLESGILTGNVMWLGSYTECQSIMVPYGNDTNQTHVDEYMFKGTPCTVTIMNTTNYDQTVSMIALGIRAVPVAGY